MSPAARPPHTRDDEELVALYALGVLDTRERRRFKTHLMECGVCQALLVQDSETLARLATLAPDLEPSIGFKQRLLRLVAEELPNLSAPEDR